MSWSPAAVLGLVQGLTEFLPISSSAHLRLVAAFAGPPDPGAAFTAVPRLGIGSAVLRYFRREIASRRLQLDPCGGRRIRGGTLTRWYIALGTIPIGVRGLDCRSNRAPELTRFGDHAEST